MAKLETNMTANQQRLLVMQQKLYNTRQIISQDNLMLATDRRRNLINCFATVANAIADDIAILPKRLPVAGKNLPDEFRRVQRGCISIIQALNDRECTKTEAVTLGRKINRRIRRISKLLATANLGNLPLRPTPVISELPKNTLVAANPKQQILKSFEELEDYRRAIEDLQNRVKIIKQQDEKTSAVEPQPIKHYDAGQEGQYGQRLHEDIEHGQKLINEAQKKIPKTISFKSGQTWIRLKVPLLVIADRFIPDSLFKTARFEFARTSPSPSLTPGYTPGFGKNKDVHISPLIIYDQIVIALPLTLARSKEFNVWLEDTVAVVGAHIGGVVPVAIGSQPAVKVAGRKPTEKFAEEMLDQQQVVRQKKSEELRRTARLARYTELQRIKQRKKIKPEELRELRALENTHEQDLVPLSISPDELTHPSVRNIKKQSPKTFRITDDKRRYFVNKHYSGVAFVWLMLHQAYNEFSRIKFNLVDFPIFGDTQTPAGKSANTEQSLQRMDELRQAREELQGDLPEKIEALAKYERQVRIKVKVLENDLITQREVLQSQQSTLAEMRDKGSMQWRDAHEAMTITLIEVAKIEGTIKALKSDTSPKIKEQIHLLKQELDERIKIHKEQRWAK